MEVFDTTITSIYGSSSSPSPPHAVISLREVCKKLRRRCDEKCMFAPYLPPSDPATFALAHRAFGASNIVKFLEEFPESKRDDTISSMVYDTGMRIRALVYDCMGIASQHQSQITHLKLELAKAWVEIVKLHLENSNLMAFLYTLIPQTPRDQHINDLIDVARNFPDNAMVNDSIGSSRETLWI